MNATLRETATGALLGSLAVTGAFAFLVGVGVIKATPWVIAWNGLLGGEGWVMAGLLGGLLFVAFGTLWGLPFTWVREPTPFKGTVFSILPTLWAWTGLPLMLGAAPLGGLDPVAAGLPLVMNGLIWGPILGWWCQRKVFGDGGTAVYM